MEKSGIDFFHKRIISFYPLINHEAEKTNVKIQAFNLCWIYFFSSKDLPNRSFNFTHYFLIFSMPVDDEFCEISINH
jgi:hypothetical protein